MYIIIIGTNILGNGLPSNSVTIPGLNNIAMFHILCILKLQEKVVSLWTYQLTLLQKWSPAFSINKLKTVKNIVVLSMGPLGNTANRKIRESLLPIQALLVT